MARALTPEQNSYQEQVNNNNDRTSMIQRLQALEIAMAAMNGNISELFGKYRTLEKSLNIMLENHTKDIKDAFRKHINMVEKATDKMAENASKAISESNEATQKFVSKDEHVNAITSISNIVKNLNIEVQKFEETILSLTHQTAANFNQKLEDHKNAIAALPSEIPGVKKEIIDRISLIAIDGQNAIARTVNFERQVIMIEKRLEQLSLLIRNLELRNA